MEEDYPLAARALMAVYRPLELRAQKKQHGKKSKKSIARKTALFILFMLHLLTACIYSFLYDLAN